MALKEFKLIILTGLPGAGKTTYAKENFNDYGKVLYIHYDEYKDKNNEYLSIEQILERRGFYNDYDTILFDGFVPDKEKRILIIYDLITYTRKNWRKYSYNRQKDIIHFNIQEYFWVPDMNACLNNDKFRNRPKSSTLSINTWASLIEPLTKNDWDNNLAEFFNEDKFVETKFLYTKSYDYKEGVIDFAKKYITTDPSNPSILKGYEWNSMYDSPCEFIELDNVLTKICPNITFLQYKKLCRECEAKINTDTRYDDYYSSTPSVYKWWEVNIDKVHQWLIDNDLIEV